DVGIGTTSPAATVDVENSGDTFINLTDSSAGVFWRFQHQSSDSSFVITKQGTGNAELKVTDNGGSGPCIELRDSDDAGTSACTILNGVLNCATGTCP
ncbi:MAG: hypothetical protein GY769_23860, partial [bacterium]|nr:hypothetical protein [bacterium]